MYLRALLRYYIYKCIPLVCFIDFGSSNGHSRGSFSSMVGEGSTGSQKYFYCLEKYLTFTLVSDETYFDV
jgi:hypothetical protein